MKKNVSIWMTLLAVILVVSSCKKKDNDENPEPQAPSNLGWYGTDNVSQIPTSVTNAPIFNSGALPAKVDLLPHFPPIGNQGQYGTCVAWASGYNMKTVIDGIQQNLNTNDLASANKQTSPKDLFYAIPDGKKGQNCNGTNFSDAMDLLLSRGAATLQTVPYTNLGSCSQSGVQNAWTQEANQRKIKNYRKINPSVQSVKEQLANNIPVVIGAKLADNFMTWNSDAVYNSNTTYNQVGQHAYHALIISGYDDSKGANGAFKVVNSWGTTWGDVGYIWMDYNFLVSQFVFDQNFYIATTDGGTNPPSPSPTPTVGVDLASWVFGDETTYGTLQFQYDNERNIYWNLYNIGTAPATASSNWSMYYIYFNAYNANDYGLLLYDEFNTSIAQNTYVVDPQNPNHITLNIDIPANNDLANVAFGTPQLYQTYYTPSNLNGLYYLVLIADAENAFQENNEQNNFFYTTGQLPKYFQNGYSNRSGVQTETAENFVEYKFVNKVPVTATNLAQSKFYSLRTPQTLNAYTSEEIGAMLKWKKKTGDLARKIEEFKLRVGKGGFGGR
jgi:C1A family cysteine protease